MQTRLTIFLPMLFSIYFHFLFIHSFAWIAGFLHVLLISLLLSIDSSASLTHFFGLFLLHSRMAFFCHLPSPVNGASAAPICGTFSFFFLIYRMNLKPLRKWKQVDESTWTILSKHLLVGESQLCTQHFNLSHQKMYDCTPFLCIGCILLGQIRCELALHATNVHSFFCSIATLKLRSFL